jgi:hypothetical protein
LRFEVSDREREREINRSISKEDFCANDERKTDLGRQRERDEDRRTEIESEREKQKQRESFIAVSS